MVRAYYWFAMENGCCRANIIIIVIIITTMNISDNNNRGVHIGRGERSQDGAEGHLCCGGRSSRGLRVYIQSVSVERPVSVCAALLRFTRAKNTHCSAAPTDDWVPLHTDDDVHARAGRRKTAATATTASN